MNPLNYQNAADAQKETGFLRSLFGPSKREIWSQLAQQIDGSFVSGGFWHPEKVVATTDQWTITLDTYTVSNGKTSTTYTRMRAPYVNKDGFRFSICRAGIFSALGEMLGFADVKIGDPSFDEAFVIKSDNPQKVRQLLSDARVRHLISAQPRIYFQVKDDEGWFGTRFPQGVDELCFTAVGVVKDLQLLHGLFDLFAAILHQLCHIGSAYENDPGVTL